MTIEMQQILLTMLFALGFGVLNVWIKDAEVFLDVALKWVSWVGMIVSIFWAVWLAVRWMIL